ncbi:unnamed protein product, partial [marine sediment metagenome]
FSDAGYFAQVGGVFLGFGIAYVLEGEYVKYEPSKLDLKWKIINLLIGLVILCKRFINYKIDFLLLKSH